MSELTKRECIEKARQYLIPGRVRAYEELGVMPVLASAAGYRFRDLDGREFQDFHLNGGTFNLGHRNPELMAVLERSLQAIGIGNHHFVSCSRADLAEALVASLAGLRYVVFTASGSEATDVAIKSARWATQRRKIVTFDVGYHGRTGLSGAAGDATSAKYFHSDSPDFLRVPFDDTAAMEVALSGGDIAAVVLESIPATYGFVTLQAGFFQRTRELCDRHGTLLVLDEVQTGLGRTGTLWALEQFQVRPDIVVVGKGLSGGLYPIAAAVLSREVGSWLEENGWGHVSTFGGADIACRVARRVLEICADEDNLAHARRLAVYLRQGLEEIGGRTGYLQCVHGLGLAMGLEFDSPSGGPDMMRELYERGLWAMFASFNSSVLQFKLGFLADPAYCDEALSKVEDAVTAAKKLPRGRGMKLAGAGERSRGASNTPGAV
jgi:acetylornithine/succinyldiaminopimelate/putrescine aminotransferase